MNSQSKIDSPKLPDFGDYIVYVDESGDHELVHADPKFPVFVLAFCIFKISDYTEIIVPSVQKLKFKYFGHDMVILHEREIRKSNGPFAILQVSSIRKQFLDDLNELVTLAPFKIVACVIDKAKYRVTGYASDSPYRVAMEFGLERVFFELQKLGQAGKITHVVFESRGTKEDSDLELQFRRLLALSNVEGMNATFSFKVAEKLTNSSGLQIADMVARPIGLHVWKPQQANRAFEIVSQKFRRSPRGAVTGWGLKIVP